MCWISAHNPGHLSTIHPQFGMCTFSIYIHVYICRLYNAHVYVVYVTYQLVTEHSEASTPVLSVYTHCAILLVSGIDSYGRDDNASQDILTVNGRLIFILHHTIYIYGIRPA